MYRYMYQAAICILIHQNVSIYIDTYLNSQSGKKDGQRYIFKYIDTFENVSILYREIWIFSIMGHLRLK